MSLSKNSIADITCIILAGGRGKRMGTSELHKVCFPVLGRPAIVRAIDQYKSAGLKRFTVVVGQMAHQVMSVVNAEHPDVTFVFQAEAKGTGHAALTACHSLAAANFSGKCLITMGDKLVDPGVIRQLVTGSEEAALSMVTLPFSGDKTDAGRVLLDGDGSIRGIVEKKDLMRARNTGQAISIGEAGFKAHEIDQMEARRNGSLYLFDFDVLWDALQRLRPDNEQGELYLTDTVGLIRSTGKSVRSVEVAREEDVMAFNTPAELLAIEEVLTIREKGPRVRSSARGSLEPARFKPAGEWLAWLRGESGDLSHLFERIYGGDAKIQELHRRQIEGVVERFAERFSPERPMVICRAPGRINLMGRHVEHRGGDVNVMAISRETVMAVSPRADDWVTLHNVNPQFPDRRFQISDLLEKTSWEDWVEFIDSATVKQVLQDAPGDWSHYARAPLLRLQHEAGSRRLKGMDCVVGTNIPMGAGLSSSSALVVAFAESAIALNGLEVETADFINLCGEGEWFVGSRGGSGDHAAIRVGKIGAVSHLGFFPFQLKGQVSLPDNLRLVVADSAIEAKKSDGARDAFNHRIAAYRIGQTLLQKAWPASSSATHLRDLLPKHLRVHNSDLYRALKLLPEWPTRNDLRSLHEEDEQENLERIFATHADIGPYDLRGVILYGLAECSRSSQFANLLETGNTAAIGRMMSISHDGDRVASWAGRENEEQWSRAKSKRYVFDTSDRRLEALAAEEVDLSDLPGSYACSTPEIDYLIDLAVSVKGVTGAQLSGAGLGGCVMVLVESESAALLEQALVSGYYEPRGLEPRIHVCHPVEGAGLVSTESFAMASS